MKIISIMRSLLTGATLDQIDVEEKARWVHDPLAHPVLEAMSERELADLPFSRGLRSASQGRACVA